ncbi:MAG: hypothetical protein JRI36_08065, partial [Deltaproteobacteria bacterium]|nr:hypothetical protein [Deltaproteobacteria bacterium]
MRPLERPRNRFWARPMRGCTSGMGAGWVFALVLVVLIGTGFAPARAQSVSITSGRGMAGVSVVLPKDGHANPAETVLDITVQDLHVETVEANGEAFHVMGLSGYTTTLEVGKPQLPAIRKTVGLSDGTASVTATVVSSSYTDYPGFKVYPVQKPLKDGEVPADFAIDQACYARDAFYPTPFVRVGKIGIWRDITVATVEIVPARFNPATGMLRVYDHIRVKLEAHAGTGLATTAASGPKKVEAKFDRFYRDEIINYDALDITVGEPTYTAPSGSLSTQSGDTLDATDQTGIPYDTSVKYLSIRHEDCSDFSTLKPLLDWHRQCGLPYASVVKTGIPTAEDIKNTISNWYNAHPELEFVLLVGDLGYLPWYPNWGGTETHDLPGDHWYACLTGGDTPDLWPEIAIGRLPVRNDLELAQQVEKILSYSKHPPYGDWLDRALLIAHKQSAPGKYQGCKESIHSATYADPFDFITAYGADPANGGDDATNADVNNAINNGVGIVNYRGHGAYGFPSNRPWGTFWGGQAAENYPAAWNESGEQYWATDAQSLENGARTPVVFSISCMNNALDNPTFDCLGRAFVMQSAGAVAFLGASRPSYTTPNHDFDRELFDAIGNEGVREIGWILNDANTELLTSYGEDSTYMDNLKIYLWLGDPAMRVWGHEPGTFVVVDYPTEVSTGVMTVRTGFYITYPGGSSAFVPIPYARVTIDGCGVYTYQETDGNGEALFNFVPAFSGQMNLTVTKADYLPYQDTIQIVPLEDKITHIQFSPASPASLCNEEVVQATFDYTTTDEGGIRIFVRPFSNGLLSPHYPPHSSDWWPYPEGSGSGWFTIDSGNVVVDQVQFQIWSADQSRLL